MAAEIIKLNKFRKSRKPRKSRPKPALKPKRFGKGHDGLKWSAFKTALLTTPIAAELMRDQLPGPSRQDDPLLESGVLAFRREENGDQQVLLISRKRSKKWGIPKGKCVPTLNFPENAAKEAFEEAGVIGYVSPFSVGVFRAKKRVGVPQVLQTIEVWVYLLEVTEIATNWPEKGKREIRWVSCDAAAGYLREPVLSHLCHRLAQS